MIGKSCFPGKVGKIALLRVWKPIAKQEGAGIVSSYVFTYMFNKRSDRLIGTNHIMILS